MSLRPPVSEQDHIQGNPGAAIELVEYGDYQCPHCGHAYPIVKQLQEALGDKLKFIFRNFPLSEIHPDARLAAVAAEAASRQGKYWEMHDIIFENQEQLKKSNLLEYARQIGLDLPRFQTDLESSDLMDIVEEDFESGVRSGVNGTPTFFVDGRKYGGSWEPEAFAAFLNSRLKEA
ncbi:DsbA family protein [Terrimonas sp. NA20]|uniref:DsbA family protein n=1 Tax=Terrimonas ginsenosidimutans TaxID=2908004 RepID=A0ABS9KYR4_9BACT|nr:thioredoxin domain-containing protein [Terrimonas ginsenosidimutans]MCG2617431.1 DsbA family protein [Terrimonas ginsenosidimutans]